MDYNHFRKELQAPASAVSVNHRALITRALTKYPVDYALYRELLQNSADAQATSASITFDPHSSSELDSVMAKNPKLIHSLDVNRMTFANNGLDFTKEDWNRLREIASGNPNETKIGAFGVGFYSVFELSDNPLVHSGNSIMTFAYAGDQLQYTFSPSETRQKGTLIDLPYRNTGKCPDLVKFTAFLAQSFMLVPLDSVELKLGPDLVLLSLSKTTSPQAPLNLPTSFKNSLNKRSPAKTLTVAKLTSTAFQVTITYLNATQMKPLLSDGFFGLGKQLVQSLTTTSNNPREETQLVCFLRRIDMYVDVNVSWAFRQKIIDTVLKPPPKQAVMSLLAHSKHEHEISEGLKPPLSQYIFPAGFDDAKIFVGFPTRQSTSIKSHLALNQLIPTMERTIIDMSNESVKEWNGQMLYMAGVMARCVYESELSVSETLDSAKFTLHRFQFGNSAPDPLIGKWVATGFWECSNLVQLPSSKGIRLSSEVRFAGDAAKVVRRMPIAQEGDSDLRGFWGHVRELGYVKQLSVDEVIDDIASDVIELDNLEPIIQWMVKVWASLTTNNRYRLINSVVINHNNTTIAFHSLQYYHEFYTLPEEFVSKNLPPSCLPSSLVDGSSHISSLMWSTLGLKRLTMAAWIESLARTEKLTVDHDMSVKCLQVIGRQWSRTDEESRRKIVGILQNTTCIPTQLGMKTPSESYIKQIQLFPHLPVISKDVLVSPDVLRAIGLRASLDMAFVLNALHQPKSEEFQWTTKDLVKYLTDNLSLLKESDWQVLRDGEFFEMTPTSDSAGAKLVRASELYPPDAALQKLGFPTLRYPGWQADSTPARILHRLGLRKFADAAVLFNAAQGSQDKCELAIQYYIRNFDAARYSPKITGSLDIPFILTTKNEIKKPRECYVDTELGSFGFNVMHPSWAKHCDHLGILKRPALSVLVARLIASPPPTMAAADPLFTYLSKRVNELNQADIEKCKHSAFIPVAENKFATPTSVFLPSENDITGGIRDLFSTIEPSIYSIPFLRQVGVHSDPSLPQIVNKVVSHPGEALDMMGSIGKYERLLATFAANWDTIEKHRNLPMKMANSAFLIGVMYPPNEKPLSTEDEKGVVSLYSPRNVAIVDDVIIFNQFKDQVATAPQESLLESLYLRLGSPKMSSLLVEEVRLGSVLTASEDEFQRIDSRIKERLQLFLQTTSKKRRSSESIDRLISRIHLTLVNDIEVVRRLRASKKIHMKITAYSSAESPFQLFAVPIKMSWLDVSRALVKATLAKPDPESVLVLEMQLSSDLSSLQEKGYNVTRLQKKHLDLNALKIKPPVQPPAILPPAADKSPQQSQVMSKYDPPPKSSLDYQKMPSKPPIALGKEPYQSAQHNQEAQNLLPPPAAKPAGDAAPYSRGFGLRKFVQGLLQPAPEPSQRNQTSSPAPSQPPPYVEQPHTTDEPMSSQDISQVLKSGINSTRAFNSQRLQGHDDDREEVPIPTNQPQCAAPKSNDLVKQQELPGGMCVYRSSNQPPAPNELLVSFQQVLRPLSDVFQCRPGSVSIYYDEDRSRIAFNYGGSLFFNAAVYQTQSRDVAEGIQYWFPVIAHELAHNLAPYHGKSHNFYSESYIQHYLGAVIELILSL